MVPARKLDTAPTLAPSSLRSKRSMDRLTVAAKAAGAVIAVMVMAAAVAAAPRHSFTLYSMAYPSSPGLEYPGWEGFESICA